ncbi:hypothetical protein Moror_4850 [Moniliophthora roreri MCA 2997]|uniref:Uncharacterized protein n=1 Tax=Moniliophthora roreri (strain MCA 2997) TaxID=1381753 RepID=V2XVT3_MONRO|nr:hypothetical protein Moror_4850 [Moniliophthora roreri MCA 2997]
MQEAVYIEIEKQEDNGSCDDIFSAVFEVTVGFGENSCVSSIFLSNPILRRRPASNVRHPASIARRCPIILHINRPQYRIIYDKTSLFFSRALDEFIPSPFNLPKSSIMFHLPHLLVGSTRSCR